MWELIVKTAPQEVVLPTNKEASVLIYKLWCLILKRLLMEHELSGISRLPQNLSKALMQRGLELSAGDLQPGCRQCSLICVSQEPEPGLYLSQHP